MGGRKIRVLVVDDSAFMRKALKRMLKADKSIEVVGDASDGQEALDKLAKLDPDVITLDVKMSGMDGLQALERIMEDKPTPVLMVSSLTNEGGSVTMRALQMGAVDFIDKTSCNTPMDILDIAELLVEKVKVIAGVDLTRIKRAGEAPVQCKVSPPRPVKVADGIPSHLVAIGASTGGPMSLEKILTCLPEDYPGAILIVQHMPVGFTRSLAERLDRQCRIRVTEAMRGDTLKPGHAYIAPGGLHLTIGKSGGQFHIDLGKSPDDVPHRPSVDVMMESVARTWPGRMMGVIMTGMGNDGSQGVRLMKKKGATVIAQDEDTCVVFGMPRAAFLTGNVDRLVRLGEIAGEIVQFV